LQDDYPVRDLEGLLRQLIFLKVAIEICSGKSYDDWSFGVLASELDDCCMTAPSVQSDQKIIRLVIVGL
jgi:hypothetical protein